MTGGAIAEAIASGVTQALTSAGCAVVEDQAELSPDGVPVRLPMPQVRPATGCGR